MTDDERDLLRENRDKARAALKLITASLGDYLPEQIALMFARIAGPFAVELRALDERLRALKPRSSQ